MLTIEQHQVLSQLARQASELLKLKLDARIRPNGAGAQSATDVSTGKRIDEELEAISKQRKILFDQADKDEAK